MRFHGLPIEVFAPTSPAARTRRGHRAAIEPAFATLQASLGLTLSASGAVAVKGDLARTLDGLEFTSSQAIQSLGRVQSVLGVITLSSTAKVTVIGTLNNSLGILTLSSSVTRAYNWDTSFWDVSFWS